MIETSMVTVPAGCTSRDGAFTNGREICFPTVQSREKVVLVRASLRDGSVTERVERMVNSNKAALSFERLEYDVCSNLTWVVNGNKQCLAFPNPGRLRPVSETSFAARNRAETLETVLGSGHVEEDPIAPAEAVAALLALLDLQVAPWVGVRFRTADDEFKTREPFVFDLALDTMQVRPGFAPVV